jgi:hypothetical protein
MRALAVMAVLLLGANLAAADAPVHRISGKVHPSGTSIPENLLRIELQFSAALHGSLDMRRVKLLEADGQEIDGAFLDLPLWNADGSRAVILLHPGRVKSGVGANVTFGRALHAGSIVTLVVDDPQLGRPIHKTWQVVAAQSRSPEPDRWSLRVPAAGGRSSLLVQLNDAVDSSAEGLIAVRAPNGNRLRGTASLLNGETAWRFVPAQPWLPGRYAIVTHPDLEDPAGNRVCARFEAREASQAECAQGTVHPFQVDRRFVSNPGELQ